LVIRDVPVDPCKPLEKRTGEVKTPLKLKPETLKRVITRREEGHHTYGYRRRGLRHGNEVNARVLKEGIRRRGT
jgi:hypothetical protein